MKMYRRLGISKKEYMAGRVNREKSLKIQFPKNERMSNVDQRHRYFIAHEILSERV